MSTYLERSALPDERARRAERRRPREAGPGGPSALVLAWTELWKRTARGSFDRLPDPARHPECWFKFV